MFKTDITIAIPNAKANDEGNIINAKLGEYLKFCDKKPMIKVEDLPMDVQFQGEIVPQATKEDKISYRALDDMEICVYENEVTLNLEIKSKYSYDKYYRFVEVVRSLAYFIGDEILPASKSKKPQIYILPIYYKVKTKDCDMEPLLSLVILEKRYNEVNVYEHTQSERKDSYTINHTRDGKVILNYKKQVS